jgi:membrane peptidoglycan carboxypeptidase
VILLALTIFGITYVRYWRFVTQQLARGPFANTTDIYAASGDGGKPELLTNVSGQNREKRRLVAFKDIPEVLVEAVVSIEDKRFFNHLGFDPYRIVKAAYVDLKSGRKQEGASTLSMQLARSLWLDTDKKWSRKFSELMITLILEQRLSKEKIFEYYSNQIYLGRSGTFSTHGFGEGARAFFGKELSEITLPEAALLAGLPQRPGYFNPYRHPHRAKARRDLVLASMLENDYITQRAVRACQERSYRDCQSSQQRFCGCAIFRRCGERGDADAFQRGPVCALPGVHHP